MLEDDYVSSLSNEERVLFEKLLVKNKVVLDFNNRTFGCFVLESTDIDIFDGNYSGRMMSMASRLRLFLEKESDFIVQKLLSDLLSYWYEIKISYDYEFITNELYEECKNIINSLNNNGVIEDIESISTLNFNNSKAINLLTTEIKDKLLENNPELALDRLHTFSMMFFRELCNKHILNFKKDDPLHTLVATYWKSLDRVENNFSEMTLQILKTNINTMNTFNSIRNTKSYAHDNVILNKSESKLICNHVITLLKFIDEIEENNAVQNSF